MNFLCLGDSICYGYGVAPGKGWTALVAAALAREHCANRLVNAGVNGETAGEGLARLPMLLAAGFDVLYVQFGLNDAWRQVTDAVFAGQLKVMIRMAEQAGLPMLLGTNHPVLIDEQETMYGGAWYKRRVEALNEVVRTAQREHPHIVLIDHEKHWLERGHIAPLLQSDGVHLSEQGNACYTELLFPVFVDFCRPVPESPT